MEDGGAFKNKRQCIYTGEFANAKDYLIPKQALGDEIHNWTISAPTTRDYINKEKKDRLPTETEIYLNELFYLKEMAALRLRYYELKIKEVQKLLKSGETVREELVPDKVAGYKNHKDKQIEAMEAEKEIKEFSDSLIDKVISKRKKDMWEENE